MPVRTLDDLSADGARVGVRVDVNSPMTDAGELADDARLLAHVDTLSELLGRGARVAVLAHQGRPGGDEFYGLQAHADRLDELLDHPVGYCDSTFSTDARRRVAELDDGEAVVLENTRFYSEEYMEFDPAAAADTHLVARLAPEFDAYVNDAFAAAHRSQPSLVGFTRHLPSYAGRVMEAELDVLGSLDDTPTPRAYVLGGAKVSDALSVARHGLENGLADAVLAAGLVGNVFLFADGVDLGNETADVVHDRGYWDDIDRAADLLDEYPDRILLPVDGAVERDGERVVVPVEEMPPARDEAVMDVGDETIARYREALADARTAVLNGPAGVFENDLFADGTRGVFEAVAATEFSVVGGGDTAAAIRRLDLSGFDHVSTGGGAALRMLTGESLPAVEALRTA